MSTEDAIKFQKVLDLFPEGAQLAVQELGLLGAPVSEAGKALAVLGGGAVKDIIDSAMNTTGTLSEEATVALSNRIKTLGTDIQNSGLADSFATAALAGGDSFFREGNNLITAMAGSAADIKKFTKTTADAQAESPTKALMNVKNALDENTVQLQKATTAIMEKLVLDPESVGARGVQGFVNDGGKLAGEAVDKLLEYFGLKEPSKDKEKKKTTSAKELDSMIMNEDGLVPGLDEFNQGTNGFRNFGSGTLAKLHGVEAVVPKKDVGQLANLLAEVGATTTNTTAGDTVTNNTTQMDMTTLNANTEKLIAATEMNSNHLNTLVTIGAMTERNTKETKNNLANMDKSIV
jgi:hypothetical protein